MRRKDFMAEDESGNGRAPFSVAADAQIDVIASRAHAIASELFATSASLQGANASESSLATLSHRLNAMAASVQALAAPAIQMRGL
jgi:hypothetical protein